MITQKTFFIIAFYLLTIASCGQKNTTSDTQTSEKQKIVSVKNLDIVVYELSIPSYDKEGIFPMTRIEIKRDSAKPTFLKFQTGGTETNVSIIDSVYSQNYNSIWDTPPTKRLDFGHSENGLLDISGLTKGTYFIRYTSCNISGNYALTLIN